MIKFEGEVSNNCKHFIRKKELSSMALISSFVFILFGVLDIALSIIINLIILWFLLVIVTALIILSFAFLPRKDFSKRIPKKIEISDIQVSWESECRREKWQFNEIKEIADMGEWYTFQFYFPRKNIYVVCDKKLLVQGSLEEFESLFEGKITKM